MHVNAHCINIDNVWYIIQHGTTLVKYEGKHEKKVALEELEAPEGWAFRDDWEVDMNRAVDEEGKLIRVMQVFLVLSE